MDNTQIDAIQNYGLDVANRTIYVNSENYGEYGDGDGGETGVDFLMATKFIKNLDYLNSLSSEPILVKTLNCGGCWFYGMAMFDAIKTSKSPVDIHARCWARSMSSIILQAARVRTLSQHTVFMIHYGEYSDYGDLRKVVSGVDFYKNLNSEMFKIYAERCYGFPIWNGASREQIAVTIEGWVQQKTDVWLTAEQALVYGFCDKVQ